MFNIFKKKDAKIQKEEMVSSQYREWREMILNVAPQTELKNIPDEVYGMLMDVGMGDGHGNFLAISIYALHTGEASLKASPGAGVVGLGNVKNITGVPEKILETGQSLISLTKPADSLDYPEAGRVYFFFLTTSGIKGYKCNLNEIQNGHPFNDVFNMFSQIKREADIFMKQQPQT